MKTKLRASAQYHCIAFTLTEVIVAVTIVVILASLVVAPVNSAITRAKIAQSLSNLRTIGAGLASYASEHGGMLPQASTADYKTPFWSDSIADYLPPARTNGWISVKGKPYTQSPVLVCPLVKKWKPRGTGGLWLQLRCDQARSERADGSHPETEFADSCCHSGVSRRCFLVYFDERLRSLRNVCNPAATE